MIVNDQRHAGGFGKADKLRSQRFDLRLIRVLGPQLQDINAALEKPLRYSQSISSGHVGEIENAI